MLTFFFLAFRISPACSGVKTPKIGERGFRSRETSISPHPRKGRLKSKNQHFYTGHHNENVFQLRNPLFPILGFFTTVQGGWIRNANLKVLFLVRICGCCLLFRDRAVFDTFSGEFNRDSTFGIPPTPDRGPNPHFWKRGPRSKNPPFPLTLEKGGEFSVQHWEVLNGVGVEGVGGIFPFFVVFFCFSSLFCFFFVFLRFSSFFFAFLRFASLFAYSPGTRANNCNLLGKWGISLRPRLHRPRSELPDKTPLFLQGNTEKMGFFLTEDYLFRPV